MRRERELVGEEDASEPGSPSFQNLRARRRRLKEQHCQQQHHGECHPFDSLLYHHVVA